MKTIERIKNDYAQEQHYNDWESLIYKQESIRNIEWHYKNIILLIQEECLHNAYKNAKIEPYQPHSSITFHKVVKESIINENNILK